MGLDTAATIGLIGSAAGVAAGGIQAAVGHKRKGEAQQGVATALTDLRKMITEGQANRMQALQVPTMGAELQERALARSTAGQVEAMQEAGAAGVIGGAGRIAQATSEAAAQQAASIDQMQAQRDKLVLTEEQRLEGQKYQGLLGLQQMELTGAQQAVADAQAQQQAGVASAFGSLSAGVGLMAQQANPYQNTCPQGKTWNPTTYSCE